MSDKSEDSPSESADADFASLDDDVRVEQPAPPQTGFRLTLLALLLSAFAVAGIAYLVLRPGPAPTQPVVDTAEIDSLRKIVESDNESISRLQQRLDDLAGRDVISATDMQNMQQQLKDALNRQLAAYDSLPDRMSNVEDTMSSIQGISSGVRDSWLLAEAEYYMQIANAQLQLAGNPQLARLALLQADDRIRQLANPALTHVRRALSDELRALKVVNGPDIEGITLTLASLADVVDSLPLRQQVELPVADDSEIGGELSGLDRAIESLKSTMSDVVSVRRVDEEIRPLIAPESAYFLRANLSLQLQVARLALLRGEQAAFQQSLDDSDAWLGEYYDATSAQVQSARQTILEIRDSLFDVAMPDISESLRMLRQYNTLSASPAGVSEPAEDQPEQ
jgi:uroporphyrin-3 C-methyltransferase